MDGNQGKSNDGGLEISPVKSNNTKSINESDLGQTRFEDSRGGGWKMAPESELIIERSTESTEEPVSLKSGLLSYCLSCKKKVPIEKATLVTLSNGRQSIRSICPDCGGKVSRIVGKNSLGNMLLQENKGIHAFCLRCRERIPIHDPTFFKLKNGRRSIRGSCPLFSGKVSRIVGKNAVKQMLGEKSGVGAFCLRCKERITVDDPSLFKLKNGRRSIRGSCPLCKGKVSRIVGKKVFEEMLASHESEYHAYCLRCKEKVPVKKPAFPTLKNGRHSVRGFCPLCDGKVSRILKKVEEAILVERMEEEHPIEPEVPEETVVEEEHLDDKIEVPPWSDIRKDISSAYCFRCGKELSDSETINDPSGKGDETARAFCIDCLEYVYQYLDPSVGLNKTIRAYVKKKRRQSIKTEDTPENPEMEYIQKASKYEWRVTTVETNVPSPDTESEVEEESQPKLLDSSTLPLIDYDKKEYQSSMESEEESLGVESEESEGSDQEVRETIDALLKDLKDKKRQDTVSEEKIEESEFEQNIKKEKMIREILPLYEKERISRDLEKYGRFSLIMPFRGFSDQEPVEEEIPPELEPVEEEAEPPVVEEEAPVLELIREEIEEPPVVEEEAETTEEERISLNEILDEMLEGTDETGEDVEELEHLDRIHGTSTSHEEIVIRQCRSCERNFCLECANMAKTEIGYHNIPEETFSEYFEPLCIHCWEKFQVRFEEAQVPEEEVRSAPVEMPDDTDELDETPYDDWTRTGTKTNERVRTVEDKKDRRKKMRERIELLRRIRDIRWKVSSPEEPKVEKVVSVEVQEVAPEEKEDEYIEPHDGRPSSKLVNSIGMRLNLISPGSFIMGSKRWSESQPVRRVNIRRPFYISIFPVTQKEWKSVLGNNPSYPKGDYLPVVNVSWNDCHKFIMKLNALEGSLRYRLPTEAEWEFAARAGSTGRYSFGDDVSKLPLYAWLGEDWDVGELHPVGLKRSNEWGLYDVHGNIWEWCQDNWHPNFNGAPADGRAWEGGGDVNRVRRGGTWTHDPEHCETAHRNRNGAGYRYKYLGFRIVRSI